MIFPSTRKHNTTTTKNKSFFSFGYILTFLFIFGFGFEFYTIVNVYNPNSYWCTYKIYKQTDGTYQVWYKGRINTCELSNVTYEQAKKYQIEKCEKMKSIVMDKSKGEYIK